MPDIPPPTSDAPPTGSPVMAAAAAAARSQASRHRLVELERRLERLRAGQASTREDVARARIAAEAQRRCYTQAQRRMAAVRSGRTRQGDDGSGLGPEPGPDARFSRLRQAFVILTTSPLDNTEVAIDPSRRRDLAAAVVDRACAASRSWSEALCQVAVALVPGVDGAGVSTYDERDVAHPLAAADDRSLLLEELQQVVGEGPGHTARVTRRPLVVLDLARQDKNWPGYVSAVRGQGVGMVSSVPVIMDGLVLASLTLYHASGSPVEMPDLSDVMTLGGLASATIIIDTDFDGESCHFEQTPGDTVDLASGVLAVRVGVGVDEALALLRGAAFSTGRRISDIAADVVAGVTDLF